MMNRYVGSRSWRKASRQRRDGVSLCFHMLLPMDPEFALFKRIMSLMAVAGLIIPMRSNVGSLLRL